LFGISFQLLRIPLMVKEQSLSDVGAGMAMREL